jgi:hypothetical protein
MQSKEDSAKRMPAENQWGMMKALLNPSHPELRQTGSVPLKAVNRGEEKVSGHSGSED